MAPKRRACQRGKRTTNKRRCAKSKGKKQKKKKLCSKLSVLAKIREQEKSLKQDLEVCTDTWSMPTIVKQTDCFLDRKFKNSTPLYRDCPRSSNNIKPRCIQEKKSVIAHRHKALAILHNQLVGLEVRFQRDIFELEAIYNKKYYNPLLALRKILLTIEPDRRNGNTCIKEDALLGPCKASFLPSGKDFTNLQTHIRNLLSSDSNNPVNQKCDDFWPQVFLHSNAIVRDLIQPGDIDILKHLREVKAEPIRVGREAPLMSKKDCSCAECDDGVGFDLLFYFNSNPFFCNDVLYKRYVIDVLPDDTDYIAVSSDNLVKRRQNENWESHEEMSEDMEKKFQSPSDNIDKLLEYNGPQVVSIRGCKIKWLARDPNDNDGMSSMIGQQSFFNFFEVCWEEKTLEHKEEIARDYEIGTYMRDNLIPRAYLIYRRPDEVSGELAEQQTKSNTTCSVIRRCPARRPIECTLEQRRNVCCQDEMKKMAAVDNENTFSCYTSDFSVAGRNIAKMCQIEDNARQQNCNQVVSQNNNVCQLNNNSLPASNNANCLMNTNTNCPVSTPQTQLCRVEEPPCPQAYTQNVVCQSPPSTATFCEPNYSMCDGYESSGELPPPPNCNRTCISQDDISLGISSLACVIRNKNALKNNYDGSVESAGSSTCGTISTNAAFATNVICTNPPPPCNNNNNNNNNMQQCSNMPPRNTTPTYQSNGVPCNNLVPYSSPVAQCNNNLVPYSTSVAPCNTNTQPYCNPPVPSYSKTVMSYNRNGGCDYDDIDDEIVLPPRCPITANSSIDVDDEIITSGQQQNCLANNSHQTVTFAAPATTYPTYEVAANPQSNLPCQIQRSYSRESCKFPGELHTCQQGRAITGCDITKTNLPDCQKSQLTDCEYRNGNMPVCLPSQTTTRSDFLDSESDLNSCKRNQSSNQGMFLESDIELNSCKRNLSSNKCSFIESDLEVNPYKQNQSYGPMCEYRENTQIPQQNHPSNMICPRENNSDIVNCQRNIPDRGPKPCQLSKPINQPSAICDRNRTQLACSRRSPKASCDFMRSSGKQHCDMVSELTPSCLAKSNIGNSADDENNWSDYNPPSCNRAFSRIKYDMRNRRYFPRNGSRKDSTLGSKNSPCSLASEKTIRKVLPGYDSSPLASEGEVDDSDVLSTKGRNTPCSDAESSSFGKYISYGTPSSSENEEEDLSRIMRNFPPKAPSCLTSSSVSDSVPGLSVCAPRVSTGVPKSSGAGKKTSALKSNIQKKRVRKVDDSDDSEAPPPLDNA